MTAFAAAAAVLAADPNLGVAAIYTSDSGQGVPVALRVVLGRPEEAVGGLSAPRSIAIAAAAMVPAAAFANCRPVRNDVLTIGETDYLIAEVIQDEVAASYTLHLRRAS